MLTSEHISVPGGRTARALQGGSGDPVVFFHAAGGISPADPLLAALAERWSVIAPVHPGFDDLDELDDIRDIHDLALYYDDLFEALGLEGASVIGHSLGGMFAAELAAHVPHRVAKLVLAAPIGLWNDAYPVTDLFIHFPRDAQKIVWADPDSAAAHELAAATASSSEGAAGENPQLAMIISMLQGLAAAGKFMWPIPDKGLARRLRRVKAQTLVVWGAEDKLAPPQYADDFVAGIAGARAEVLDGAGHMVPYERRDAVLGLLDSFLKS